MFTIVLELFSKLLESPLNLIVGTLLAILVIKYSLRDFRCSVSTSKLFKAILKALSKAN